MCPATGSVSYVLFAEPFGENSSMDVNGYKMRRAAVEVMSAGTTESFAGSVMVAYEAP